MFSKKRSRALVPAIAVLFALSSVPVEARRSATKVLEGNAKMKIVIGGSYRKFMKEVCEAKEIFQKSGAIVTEPLCTEVLNPGDHFVVMKDDLKHNDVSKITEEDRLSIEKKFLKNVAESDIFYVMNKGGYVGYNLTFEVGYAYALGKTVYCAEPLAKENGLQKDLFCKVVPVDEMVKIIKNRK